MRLGIACKCLNNYVNFTFSDILLDEKMRNCFGVKKFSAFSMNRLLGCHIHPFKSLEEVLKEISLDKKEKAKRPKKRNKIEIAENTVRTKKVRKKTRSVPYRLSDQLAEVVGKKFMPRTHVTKYLWKYIKTHGLQKESDKRMVICDGKLKALFSVKEVHCFTMMKVLSEIHIHEKVDNELYWDDYRSDEDELD